MLSRPEPGSREHIKLWLAGKPRNEVVWWNRFGCRCASDQYWLETTDSAFTRAWTERGAYSPVCLLSEIAAEVAKGLPFSAGTLSTQDWKFTWGELYDEVCRVWE
jgi:hypothetical protein